MSRSRSLGLIAAISLASGAASANWPQRIPNGICGACHVSAAGGGPRTVFGSDFEFGGDTSSDGGWGDNRDIAANESTVFLPADQGFDMYS